MPLFPDKAQIIKKLAPHVINQIAAGEVIERPASVLKELVENSLDAQAQNIEISFEEGGTIELIVIDDGHGIRKQDLKLALTQHATSKIDSIEQLDQLYSFGFRGEALASIASISRFELCSKTPEAEWGYKIAVGQFSNILPEITPIAIPNGTQIYVRDLFYNIPARRKFLASLKTETLRLQDMFIRLALSEYGVSFVLKNGAKLLYHLPRLLNPEHQQDRIVKIAGKTFLQKAHRLQNTHDSMNFSGWIAPKGGIRNGSKLQYFFINRRIIKDKIIHHAIKQAWLDAGQIEAPAFILYLDLHPASFDINVHPTKYEVRFNEPRLVHQFIYKTIYNTLKNNGLSQGPMGTALPPLSSKDSTQSNSNTSSETKPHNNLLVHAYVNLGQTAIAYGSEQVFVLNLQGIACEEFLNARTKPLLLPHKISLSAQGLNHWNLINHRLNTLGFECSLLNESHILLRAAPVGLDLNRLTQDFNDYLPELLKWPENLLSKKLFWPLVEVNPLESLEIAERYLNTYQDQDYLIKRWSYDFLHEHFWSKF